MEQKHISYNSAGDKLLPQYPWFVSENIGAEEDGSTNHILYTLHNPLSKYQCQIPELSGRHIRGYYHGWVILSSHPQNVTWSLWNPVTSKTINFPPLILKDGDSESIGQCCLSAPPDDPNSVLLLTRTNKPTFVFFRLASKRNKRRWTEMSYASQLKRITGEDDVFIYSLACCNGKVYALNINGSFADFVIQVKIVVKEKEVLIKLLLLGASPFPSSNLCSDLTSFLKGSCKELFYIIVGFNEGRLEGVYLFKLDMTTLKSEEIERFKNLDMSSMMWHEVEDLEDLDTSKDMWEELIDLKDTIYFVDLTRDHAVYYKPETASDLGGYIHIRDRMGKILYSYHVENNTISLSSMPSLVQTTSNVSVWECRLKDGHEEAKCTIDSKQEEEQIMVKLVTDNKIGFNESNLLNLPFDILEMIMEHCVGVEYMNFRATCKHCHLAAPLIHWGNKTSLGRLQAYSLLSPWLMVVDKNQGNVTFTDPMTGDNYFKKNLQALNDDLSIRCSRFGWLLLESIEYEGLVFFNPLTCDLRKLPEVEADDNLESLCFSAPPTSPDCMVVGFSTSDYWHVFIHFVAQEPSWRRLSVGVVPYSISCPTFFGQDLYALRNKGELIAFKDLGQADNSCTLVDAKDPRSCCKSSGEYFLVKCDQDLLLINVSMFGETIEVYKRNDSKQEWEKINGVGKHMIYICRTTCLCIEAKSREMENKIYFPRLYSKNKKVVFYSFETS
nr:cation/H+ exchanger, cation/H+ exchanger, CPA1 family [Tanacetum cinerariifolium]